MVPQIAQLKEVNESPRFAATRSEGTKERSGAKSLTRCYVKGCVFADRKDSLRLSQNIRDHPDVCILTKTCVTSQHGLPLSKCNAPFVRRTFEIRCTSKRQTSSQICVRRASLQQRFSLEGASPRRANKNNVRGSLARDDVLAGLLNGSARLRGFNLSGWVCGEGMMCVREGGGGGGGGRGDSPHLHRSENGNSGRGVARPPRQRASGWSLFECVCVRFPNPPVF
jgi:hypothetical protein